MSESSPEVVPGGTSGVSRRDGWTYDRFVEVGRTVVTTSAWYLGDLVLDMCASAEARPITVYADDIGVSRKTIEGYRKVARAYPVDVQTSVAVPWSVCNIFCSQDDRMDLVQDPSWTTASARDEVASRSQAVEDRRNRLDEWTRSQSRRNPPPGSEDRPRNTPVESAEDLGRPDVQPGPEVDLTDLVSRSVINDDVVIEYLNGLSPDRLMSILDRVRSFTAMSRVAEVVQPGDSPPEDPGWTQSREDLLNTPLSGARSMWTEE